MHGRGKPRGIGVRTNATSAGGEFMSQDPAAVADCAVPDESGSFFISSHPSLLNAWEGEPRNRGFRSLSRTIEFSQYENSRHLHSRCCTFPRKLDFSHAISHALKAFDSPFSLTVSHFFFHARAVGKYLFHSSLQNA